MSVRRSLLSTMLLVVAVVHLNLYAREHYRYIPSIGVLFLATVVVSVGLAVILWVRPSKVLLAFAIVFALGTIGGYLGSLILPGGIFGFRELSISYSGAIALVAELSVAVVGAEMFRRVQRLA